MDKLLPCPFCNSVDAPSIHGLEIGHRGGYSFGWCDTNYGGCGAQSGAQSTKGAAISAWNRRDTDPALLALARLAAKLVRRGLGDGFTLGDLLVTDALKSGVFVPIATDSDYDGPVFAPGIADAIARLLAPDGADGAGEVQP